MRLNVTSHSKRLRWVLIHVILGLIGTYTPIFIILYFYLSLFINFFTTERTDYIIAKNLVYFVSLETLCRLSGTEPFVPYEIGKYATLFFIIYGLLHKRIQLSIGLGLSLCLIPALFYDFSGQVGWSDYIFNFLGPFNTGLAIIFFSKQTFTLTKLMELINVMILPIISVLAYTVFSTGNYADIEFDLGANFEATGGFGSNQISTILGFGFFIGAVSIIRNYRFSGYLFLDVVITLLFFFQGLLSFSRGGVIVALIAFIVVLFGKNKYAEKGSATVANTHTHGRYGLLIIAALASLFIGVNILSKGKLVERYMGENRATLDNRIEKSINTMTTGRWEIVLSDFELFRDRAITGVGIGASRYLRQENQGALTHIELGRLLAEHGIFGVLYILLLYRFAMKLKRSDDYFSSILYGFLLIGVFTTFHSSFRTFLPSILIGLGAANVYIMNPPMFSNRERRNT